MRIGLLGCKGTTLDLLHAILSESPFPLHQVLTLPPEAAERNRVAFRMEDRIEALCRDRGVPCARVRSYALKAPEDLALFREARIDLLLVLGWERLLPPAILGTLGRFACGMHGSPFGLPRGRGRSPLNWALITGQDRFVTSLFRYDAGTDSGDVLGSQAFEITPFDTIATLHQKNRIAMYALLKRHVPGIAAGREAPVPQPPGKPTYYPKRTPDDGGIDWRRTTREVHDLIRAVAPPYPPAFFLLGDRRVFVHEACPFDRGLFPEGAAPGEVLDVSPSLGQFVVRTSDGSLLVKAFEGAALAELPVGTVLGGVDHRETLRRVVQAYPPGIGPDQWEIRAP